MAEAAAQSTNNKRKTTNFTSYLDSTALLSGGSDTNLEDSLKPTLLPNELEVVSAKNVFLYNSSTESLKNANSISGLLVVTNFKLSFLTVEKCDNKSSYQENVYLGKNDVTLSNIDSVYQITEKKRRLVQQSGKISSKIEALHIICKNFRTMKFGFKCSEVGKAKLIAEALVKFAFPNQHNLLFLYNFKEKYYNTARNTPMFNQKSDWIQEMARCRATGWRVLSVERTDNVPLDTLPMHYVIPKSVSESEYTRLSNCFRKSRNAIWVYGLENASLVRMAELMPTITDTKQENTILELVRKCDPLMRQPYIMELSKMLPSIQDIGISYFKLKDLCTPDSTRKFMFQDAKYYSQLDKTCWLLYVSLCLKFSTEAANRIRSGQTVVLQECDGRDMCCLISSLTQLLLDSHFRTIIGFQMLIQKEWVALGHPFSDRLGHVINSESTEQSPLILLFLDCTWQLLQQFPHEFEFSETFLTSIWDTMFLPIFDTFQFNCEHDRQSARKNEKIILRSVWDWGEQFSDKDIQLFENPLYKKLILNYNQDSAVLSSPSKQQQQDVNCFLEPQHNLRDLDIWMQCFYRWLPLLEINNGGYPQIDFFNRIIFRSITKLQQILQSREYDNDDIPKTINDEDNSAFNWLNTTSISSFFPFSGGNKISNELIDIFALSNAMLTDGSMYDEFSMT